MPYYSTRSITLVSSSARTANGVSSAYSVADIIEGRVYISITATSGSGAPTLTIIVQDSDDGGTTWYTHTASSGLTATGQTPLNLTNFGKTIRISWTITGTSPSFTFSVVMVGKG